MQKNKKFQNLEEKNLNFALSYLLNMPVAEIQVNQNKKSWVRDLISFLTSNGWKYNGVLENPKLDYLENPTFNCFEDEFDTSLRNPFENFKVLENSKFVNNNKKYQGLEGKYLAAVFDPIRCVWDAYPKASEVFSQIHFVVVDSHFTIIYDPREEYQNLRHYPFSNLIGYNGLKYIYLINK